MYRKIIRPAGFGIAAALVFPMFVNAELPVTPKVPARTFDWNPTDTQPLPGAPVTGIKEECIRLVPYGCTRFRISMFPVTEKAWGK